MLVGAAETKIGIGHSLNFATMSICITSPQWEHHVASNFFAIQLGRFRLGIEGRATASASMGVGVQAVATTDGEACIGFTLGIPGAEASLSVGLTGTWFITDPPRSSMLWNGTKMLVSYIGARGNTKQK